MMTAMARLPCKQTTLPSQQTRYAPAPPITVNPSFAQSRGYWEMQQPVQTHPQPPFVRNHHRHHADHVGKRKSAVELLQESKAFYVKSETVLDRKQELKNSGHLQVSQVTAPGAPPRLLRKCASGGGVPGQGCGAVHQQQQQNQQPQPCCWATCHDNDRPLPPKSPRLIPVPQRRSGSSSTNNNTLGGGPCSGPSSDQLQAKLRRLLNTDSKENVFFPEVANVPAPAEYATPAQPVHIDDHEQQQTTREDKFRYSPGGSLSPSCRDDDRTWGGDARFKFGRSNSHSHGVRSGRSSSGRSSSHRNHSNRGDYNQVDRMHCGDGGGGSGAGSASSAIEAIGSVVCHKSLPDLHTSTRRRASLSPRASTKSSSRKQLREAAAAAAVGSCPDCETGSDYSDRSFNRDSVHYRRSSKKRCSSRHIRRSMGSGGGDASSVLSSGGRTQKSSGSSKLSHGATARDSGGSSGHCTHRSEPPPRIQDCWSHVRRDSGASTQHSTERDRSRKSSSYNNGTPPAIVRHYSPDSETSNSQTDYSPTCNSRFSDGWKEGRGRPILRSKSDISDRYWRHDSTGARSGPKIPARPPRSMTQLESFFDRLGLDPDNYQHITEPSSKTSSPVFFDSVSSVDSALGLYPSWAGNGAAAAGQSQGQWLPNNNDECLGSNQRAGDAPSIVERNARIIKWLCQCRKVQFGYS
ncbi:uncharacterized protein LOC100118423 isoform X1 [Nasonia vitripennis]|uniref:Centrosome-associated FAM110 C-terminal domain-containing protein n=1 Tax=Nasonia vitripennis TaxID=7425 RepID=A0A7M7Q3I5_NASVI|nr:uncharacterized protein LOC100118423 isoform X1 [Nasonia vitripennis]XP_031780414.1 uncharacterized protein LOC100118423 isoform X1 [Nasonia vitripennis]XP_031780415.1 uncharacterized protein LOC100118423 isoform X1 [Nasonia vitripennis]